MRGQKGQAIVLIAIMLAVVVGMAALAIDGSRAYSLRRDLQAAADAAALAAGDSLQQSGSYPTAEAAASSIFGTNMRLYANPACAPGYGAPGASSLTITCTYSDGTTLTQVVQDLGAGGSLFSLTASKNLVLQFARILTNGTTPRLSAIAAGGVNSLLYQPTIAALSQAGCGGAPGAAITVTSGGALGVVGDIVSSGSISSAGVILVAGDTYARCQASVPGLLSLCYPSGNVPPCTYPDVAGVTRSGYRFSDPNYPAPAVVGGSQPKPADNVVIFPGAYAVDPAFKANSCYFVAGGVYRWTGGYTNTNSFISNELRPPDEPQVGDNTQLASHQFWNVGQADCAGSVQVTAVGGLKPIASGQWAFVVTSTRTAVYLGQSYVRESAPSVCYRVTTGGGSRNVQVNVSNVPGATAYNIYAAPSGSCNGPFGLAQTLPVSGTPQNDNTNPCPAFTGNSCSLGHQAMTLNSDDLGPPFAPNGAAAPGVIGAYPPAPQTPPLRNNLPNENANRAPPPGGDRANENQCDAFGGTLTTCPGDVTPGAVVFVIPSGGCYNAGSNSDNYIFSGYQYNWLVVYEPGNGSPPANPCANSLGAAADSAYIGLVYTPAASITITKASTFRTDESGGIIANTLTFSGQLPTIIGDPTDYGPVPPASRLVD